MSHPTMEPQVGLALPCPACGEKNAGIAFHLDTELLVCSECEVEFSIDRVRDFITQWMPVVHWADEFPRAKAKE